MAIPVSLRAEGDPAGGNRFTGVSLAAPIAEADPVKRINMIHEQMITRREDAGLDRGVGDRTRSSTCCPTP